MNQHRIRLLTGLVLAAAVALVSSTGDTVRAQSKGPGKDKVTRDEAYVRKFKRVSPSEQRAAARRAAKSGLKPGIAGKAGTAAATTGKAGPLAVQDRAAARMSGGQQPDPGGVPHYFGPYGNWAFSPLPTGPVAILTVLEAGSGYNNPLVTIEDAYLPAAPAAGGFTPATVAASLDDGEITGFSIADGGAGYTAPVVTIVDDPALCGVDPQPECGTGAVADAVIGGALTGGMRKFVDGLPGLGPTGANNVIQAHGAGQYIPVGIAEPVTFSGQQADYYEIALVEYSEKMHSDLPATRLRGYVQLETPGVLQVIADSQSNPDPAKRLPPSKSVPVGGGRVALDNPHYLGPLVVAQGRVIGMANGAPKPVRIKFYNLLPTGSGGNLFLPVDETVGGSGVGPALPGTAGDKFTQNRATIHLHGNNTVWISDGNTHQWITPAGESTPYPAGVSARNVPDMGSDCDGDPVNAPGLPGRSGCMTFFYTNAQSARLQFYHDHAHGITRLNVYAGEAAGYLLTDAVEQDMINGTNVSGVNPAFLKVLPDVGIPLIIQDKTWVDETTVYGQDPTWNWGTAPGTAVRGDLWYPHVYMTVQNPWDVSGTNGFGRWFYGPWFNPPTPVCVGGGPVGCIEVGVVPNEYADPASPGYSPLEPPMRPGVPNPSVPGESFMDTPIVNGTAYPVLEVEPKAYRFRILNAANDRFLNLQLYKAYQQENFHFGSGAADPSTPTLPCGSDPRVCTEVKMVPVSVAPANQYADTPSGIPDPATKGPAWIQIGTEGGFMPAPVVVPQQPIGYNLDPAYFNFGIVNQHSLFLGSAERADVVVDFSAFAGETLILYNDSPAPVPAGAAPYDFYTGDGNLMDGGGAPNTQPGYGPNTRTIMQIRVTKPLTTPTTDVSLANLRSVFEARTGVKRGVFEVSQDPIIVPQAAYNSAYNNTFPSDASQFMLNLGDKDKTFRPLGYDTTTGAWNLQPAVTIPLEMKGMHDEMGGVYDTMFGRMSGMLGLTNPSSPVHVLIPYGYSSPPTDIVKGSLEFTPVGQLADGTQLWRIFHNGVDTHPIHTHLFTAQLITRVGQDGQVAAGTVAVDPSDLGWKDTFKVNPLEVTFLALRPTVPTPSQLPFEVPDSVRLIDPALPEGATLPPPAPAGWFDPNGNAIPEILNHFVNFGWEYVWHCHILSHEEMDFMHSLVFAVPPKAPVLTSLTVSGTTSRQVNVRWTDNSLKETGYRIERATDARFTTGLATFNAIANAVLFTDTSVTNDTAYWYRVTAVGATVGDTSLAGFPTMSADSVSNVLAVSVGTPATAVPASPTLLTAVVQVGLQVRVQWRDNATNETGFVVERCTGAGCTNFAQIAAPAARTGTGSVTFLDAAIATGTTYVYRVWAVNGVGQSVAPTNAATAIVPATPAVPASFIVAAVKAGTNYTATLTWTAGTNPTNFTIQRARNATFTTGLFNLQVGGAARTFSETLARNTTFYYRIRANDSISGPSQWANALPFPIRTGN